MLRRDFLFSALGTAGAIALGAEGLKSLRGGRRLSFVRPPGAVAESEFIHRCIGCAKCLEVCTNDCIRLLDTQGSLAKLHTPVIVPRAKGCTLCMACTKVCPTGALAPVSRPTDARMGTAELSQSLCFSYNGRTCGVCYQACPLQGEAMTIGLFEQPTVHANKCVGCGLCEQACVHLPHAIRVHNRERFA